MNPDNHTWDLLVGALKGTLGEAEQREFDRWAAEAENRRFYNNLTRVWREIQQRAAGKLAFERQSLGEICRYMARWYDTEIHITPALAHNYAYTFTITNEPLEEILRIMSRINPIAYTFAEDNTVTISELE